MTMAKLKAPVGTQILTHPNHHISLYRIMPSAPSPLAKYHQSLDEVLTLKQLFMAWYATACSTTVVWHAGKHAQKPTNHLWFIYGSVRYVGTSPRSSIFLHFLETLISLIWGNCYYTHRGKAARVFHCIETLPLEETRRDKKLKQLVEISWDTLNINIIFWGHQKFTRKTLKTTVVDPFWLRMPWQNSFAFYHQSMLKYIQTQNAKTAMSENEKHGRNETTKLRPTSTLISFGVSGLRPPSYESPHWAVRPKVWRAIWESPLGSPDRCKDDFLLVGVCCFPQELMENRNAFDKTFAVVPLNNDPCFTARSWDKMYKHVHESMFNYWL